MDQVSPTRFEADGRVPIVEVNERLGVALPEDGDFDTIAGFLLDRFGRVPLKGESDEIPEAVFEILSATPTKIDRIAILLREPAPEQAREETRDD
jgi:putative hemolysin